MENDKIEKLYNDWKINIPGLSFEEFKNQLEEYQIIPKNSDLKNKLLNIDNHIKFMELMKWMEDQINNWDEEEILKNIKFPIFQNSSWGDDEWIIIKDFLLDLDSISFYINDYKIQIDDDDYPGFKKFWNEIEDRYLYKNWKDGRFEKIKWDWK